MLVPIIIKALDGNTANASVTLADGTRIPGIEIAQVTLDANSDVVHADLRLNQVAIECRATSDLTDLVLKIYRQLQHMDQSLLLETLQRIEPEKEL